jgi:hypothetical protein
VKEFLLFVQFGVYCSWIGILSFYQLQKIPTYYIFEYLFFPQSCYSFILELQLDMLFFCDVSWLISLDLSSNLLILPSAVHSLIEFFIWMIFKFCFSHQKFFNFPLYFASHF